MESYKPLTAWRCDVCGESIKRAEEGYVFWGTDEHLRPYGFQIAHQVRCDNGAPRSAALRDFLGADGLTRLLAMLSDGELIARQGRETSPDTLPVNMDEFVHFVRRVQTPHYEEASLRFNNPRVQQDYSGANEYAPYTQEYLQWMVRDYEASN